jgi:predicted RNA-binding protein
MLSVDNIISILENDLKEKRRPSAELTVNSFEDGVEIWNHKDVIDFYQGRAMKWQPRYDTAVFLPSSASKPYPYSPSHKKGYLRALLPILKQIDLFVVSEPMVIVPYCYSDEYPVHSYDYNHYKFYIGKLSNPLARESRDIFVDRLSSWISKYHEKYSKKILILPTSWHLKIFKSALRKTTFSINDYHVIRIPGRPNTEFSSKGIRKQLMELSEEG